MTNEEGTCSGRRPVSFALVHTQKSHVFDFLPFLLLPSFHVLSAGSYRCAFLDSHDRVRAMDCDTSQTNPPIDGDPRRGLSTNLSTSIQKSTTRSSSKRVKEGDDSFESEHRRANTPNGYFNCNVANQSKPTSSISKPLPSKPEATTRPSYPAFRISFENEQRPSELSVLKDINRQCRISLSYGRYSSFNKKNFFLLYANSTEQYERLLDKNTWPEKICSFNYFLSPPTKVPTCFSIVAVGIPAQWDTAELEADIKKQYATVLKVERIFVKGGIPISKVRIDFSSNRELAAILKTQRLLFDDENTSYPIQPYTPPSKVLRCFNCQQYNDHIAVNCPHKDAPVCFRCSQSHAFNPQCQNTICCAHCKGDHLTGSPNCQIKIEERRKQNASMKSNPVTTSQQPRPFRPAWNSQPAPANDLVPAGVCTTTLPRTNEDWPYACLTEKLDTLITKVDALALEQATIRKNLEDMKFDYHACQNELSTIKSFLRETISPFLCEMSEAFLRKNTTANKERFRAMFNKFKDVLTEHPKSLSVASPSAEASHISSPNESSSQAF